MEGQVGHLLVRFGDLCAEVRRSLVADWCGGSTGFEETVVLRSRTCHSSSFVKREKESISLWLISSERMAHNLQVYKQTKKSILNA